MCLIILRRVRYIIIVLQRLGIPAPFCVHIDRDLAGLRLMPKDVKPPVVETLDEPEDDREDSVEV